MDFAKEFRNTIESATTLLGKTVNPNKYNVIDRGLPTRRKASGLEQWVFIFSV